MEVTVIMVSNPFSEDKKIFIPAGTGYLSV